MLMERHGKIIILIGIVIVIAGLIIWLAGDKLRFLGRLPGDINIERGNMRVFIPVTTMLLISVVLSLIFWLMNKMGR
jgi:hypothetical protein